MKHIYSDMKWILPAMAKPGTQGVLLRAALAIPGTLPDLSQLKYTPGQLPFTGHLPELNNSRKDLRPGETGADAAACAGRRYTRECGEPDND